MPDAVQTPDLDDESDGPICPACNTQMIPSTKLCHACGQDITKPVAPPEPPPPPPGQSDLWETSQWAAKPEEPQAPPPTAQYQYPRPTHKKRSVQWPGGETGPILPTPQVPAPSPADWSTPQFPQLPQHPQPQAQQHYPPPPEPPMEQAQHDPHGAAPPPPPAIPGMIPASGNAAMPPQQAPMEQHPAHGSSPQMPPPPPAIPGMAPPAGGFSGGTAAPPPPPPSQLPPSHGGGFGGQAPPPPLPPSIPGMSQAPGPPPPPQIPGMNATTGAPGINTEFGMGVPPPPPPPPALSGGAPAPPAPPGQPRPVAARAPGPAPARLQSSPPVPTAPPGTSGASGFTSVPEIPTQPPPPPVPELPGNADAPKAKMRLKKKSEPAPTEEPRGLDALVPTEAATAPAPTPAAPAPTPAAPEAPSLTPEPEAVEAPPIPAKKKSIGSRLLKCVVSLLIIGGIAYYYLTLSEFKLVGEEFADPSWGEAIASSEAWAYYFQQETAAKSSKPYVQFSLSVAAQEGDNAGGAYLLKVQEPKTQDVLASGHLLVKGALLPDHRSQLVATAAQDMFAVRGATDRQFVERMIAHSMDASEADMMVYLGAIERVGPGAQSAIVVLKKWQSAKRAKTRMAVLKAISSVLSKPDSRDDLIQLLLDFCTDPDRNIQKHASETLLSLEPSPVTVHLRGLESEDFATVKSAVDFFLRLGRRNEQGVKPLLAVANSTRPESLRIAAIAALAARAKRDRAVLHGLKAAAQDQKASETLREAAKRAHMVVGLPGSEWQMTINQKNGQSQQYTVNFAQAGNLLWKQGEQTDRDFWRYDGENLHFTIRGQDYTAKPRNFRTISGSAGELNWAATRQNGQDD